VIVLLAFATSASAVEGDWKFPNLNPFSKTTKKKKSTRASVSDKGSGWHVPSMKMPSMPFAGSSKRKKSRSNEPSMATKVTQGTKDMFSKSVDAITFWDNDSKGSKGSAKKRSSARTARKDSSFFGFSNDDDEQQINSVNEFLGEPRPQPGGF
jgi:hypothetical protein